MNLIKNSVDASQEELLKKFGKFLRNNREELRNLTISNKEWRIKQYKVIGIDYTLNKENCSSFQLIDSDNKLLNKILLVFFHIHKEVMRFDKESYHLLQKLVFIEDDINIFMNSNTDSKIHSHEERMANAAIKFSYILEDLLNLKFLLQNMIYVANNLFQQIGALVSMDKYMKINCVSIFPSSLDDIGKIFKNILLLDNIISNSNFNIYLKIYKDLIVKQSKSNENIDKNAYSNLLNTLRDLELLFEGNMFQLGIDSLVNCKSKIKSRVHTKLANFIMTYIKNLTSTISGYEENISELNETENVIYLNIFAVIYQNIFGNFDHKTLRTIIELNNKYCAISCINIIWNGNEFLKQQVPGLFKNNINYSKFQQNYLINKVQQLNKDSIIYAIQISQWIIQIHKESQKTTTDIKQDTLRFRFQLIMQGLRFGGEMSNIIKVITNLHMKLLIPIPKQLIPTIYKLIEYLKIIQNTFENYEQFIADNLGFISQYLQFKVLYFVGVCKKKVTTEIHKEKKIDILSALQIIEKLLYGTVTLDRLNIICLALNLTEPRTTFGSEAIIKIQKEISELKVLAELKFQISQLCETSFLFWHQNLLSVYFKQLLAHPLNQRKIAFILSSSNNSITEQTEYLSNTENFPKFVDKEFEQHVLVKLCNSIEINLRLNFHSNIQVDKFNPFEINNNVVTEDRRTLVELNPTLLNGKYIFVQDYIEHYLSSMFYNLTTISLKDWRTYGEMRCLAELNYGLETVDDLLPIQSLDQGLDVLEIMRNIHIFVAKYLYNLNNQVFIEFSSKSKHLNTINIRNIANSLRTHGFGIVNTTVNYVYQFLRKKFFIFSQFIFDERIKSRLAKDLKYFKENNINERNHQIFSYDRANLFNRDIKKLGVSNKGESYLDQFRKLISQIGNSMGYVRMIKSGCNHVSANTSIFLPTLDENLEFVMLSKRDGLSEVTIEAACNLESDIQQISKSYSEGSLYFKLLVNTFIPFFRNPNHSHLKNFFVIVPALTLNFIEHIIVSKEKLNKKNKEGALFTDDGFAMGLIYILKLLDQITNFNSLNWYRAVQYKIKSEREKIVIEQKKIGNVADEKLSQTLRLSEIRLNTFQQEFELLFYNLSSAKIFFQN